jgi:hypothetical protein
MKRTIASAIGVASLVLCAGGCATQKSAARAIAARELGCPEDSIHIVGDDKRMYHASGCGASVRIACHDPYDSTGAEWGWTDPLTSGKRSQCEALVGGGVKTTQTTSASATSATFDRELAAKLLASAVERARTCGAPSGGPRGEGHARITFANQGTVERVELDPSFVDTEAGRCVEREMTRVSLPRFDGGPVTVKKAFLVD